MEEKSIDQLRREAQELYQTKLQAYNLAQKETTQKEFKKPKELERNVKPAAIQSEPDRQNTNLFRHEFRETTYQAKPQSYQQALKEEPKEFQRPKMPEKAVQQATLTLELDENTERLRREAQELYQSRLRAYQEAQKQPVQEPENAKKEKQPAPTAKSIFFGQQSTLLPKNAAINAPLKKSLPKNNWFVVSMFSIMLVIVLVKLLLFKP